MSKWIEELPQPKYRYYAVMELKEGAGYRISTAVVNTVGIVDKAVLIKHLQDVGYSDFEITFVSLYGYWKARWTMLRARYRAWKRHIETELTHRTVVLEDEQDDEPS